MNLFERIFGSTEDDEELQTEYEKQQENISVSEDIIHEPIQFEATGEREAERKIYLTKTSIIVKVGNRGISAPINSCSVQFGKHSNTFRVTVVVDGGYGKGLRLNKQDFINFWNELSALRGHSSQA